MTMWIAVLVGCCLITDPAMAQSTPSSTSVTPLSLPTGPSEDWVHLLGTTSDKDTCTYNRMNSAHRKAADVLIEHRATHKVAIDKAVSEMEALNQQAESLAKELNALTVKVNALNAKIEGQTKALEREHTAHTRKWARYGSGIPSSLYASYTVEHEQIQRQAREIERLLDQMDVLLKPQGSLQQRASYILKSIEAIMNRAEVKTEERNWSSFVNTSGVRCY